jgi:DNA-binding protein HU-beta
VANIRKNDFISEIAISAGVGFETAKAVLDAFQQVVTSFMKSGDVVVLDKIGRLDAPMGKPRKGRHPRTGEVINIPSRMTPRYRASAELKRELRS